MDIVGFPPRSTEESRKKRRQEWIDAEKQRRKEKLARDQGFACRRMLWFWDLNPRAVNDNRRRGQDG